MPFIGNKPSAVPLTSADIADGIITSAKIVDATITNSDVASSIITGQTAETSIAGGDSVLIYDDSASALRKMTRTNFVSGLGGVAGITTSSTSGTALNITSNNDLEISAGKTINFLSSTPPLINIDNSTVTVTLTAGSSIDYPSNSGIYFICDHTNSGQSGMFTAGGGTTQLSGGGSFFTTSSSPSNAIGFFHNSSSYRLKNGSSISLTISVFNIKLRNST